MIPPELINLGTAGIIALTLMVVVQMMKPGLAALVKAQNDITAVNTKLLDHLHESDRVVDRNSDEWQRNAAETKELRAAIASLADAQTALVKAIPDTIAGIMRGDEVLTARLDTHDAQAREGIARVEAKLSAIEGQMASVLAKIESGHLSRAEIARQFREVMDEIASLKPPPPQDPPPVALKQVAKDGEEKDGEKEKVA